MKLHFVIEEPDKKVRDYIVDQYASNDIQVAKRKEHLIINAEGSFEHLMVIFARGMHGRRYTMTLEKDGDEDG